VASFIAAIVAPAGRLRHRDDMGLLEPGSAFDAFRHALANARALSQLPVTPMVQAARFFADLTLRSSVRFAAIRAAPPKPRGGRTATCGRRSNFEKNALGFAEAVDHADCVKKRCSAR